MSFVSPLYWQIQYLVNNLNKKNHKSNVSELNQLVVLYGKDALTFLLICLLNEIEYREGKHSHTKELVKIQLFVHELIQASLRPNFTSILNQVVKETQFGMKNAEGNVTASHLVQFCKVMKIPLAQQIGIGLALAQSDESYAKEGVMFLADQIKVLENSGFTLHENVVHDLVVFLKLCPTMGEKRHDLIRIVNQAHSALVESNVQIATVLKAPSAFVDTMEMDNAEFDLDALMKDLQEACHLHELMEDAGCEITNSVKEFNTFLASVELEKVIIPVGDIAGLLTMLARLGKSSSAWNLDVLSTAMKRTFSSTNWKDVVKALDRTEFRIESQAKLIALLTAFKRFSGEDLPLSEMLLPWTHVDCQMAFIREAVRAGPQWISFASTEQGKFFEGCDMSSVPANKAWSSVDLVDALLELCDTDMAKDAILLLEEGKSHCPHVLLSVLASRKERWSGMRTKLYNEIFEMCLSKRLFTAPMLQSLWMSESSSVLNAARHSFDNVHGLLSPLFALFHSTPELWHAVLHCEEHSILSISLAITGANHDSVNLEKWLTDRVTTSGISFVNFVLQYLENASLSAIPKSKLTAESSTHLTVESLVICLTQLHVLKKAFPDPLVVVIRAVYTACAVTHPSLKTTVPWSNPADDPAHFGHLGRAQKPEELEAYSSEVLKRIYDSDGEEVLNLLLRCRDSPARQDLQVYAHVIHQFFDEQRFLHQYPKPQLERTAHFFAQLLLRNILTPVGQKQALTRIEQGLGSPLNSTLLAFALQVAHQLKDQIDRYPTLQKVLKTIPVEVRTGKAPQPPPTLPSITTRSSLPSPKLNPLASPVKQPVMPMARQAMPVDTIMGEGSKIRELDILEPPQSVQDRVHFILNNVDESNIMTKVEEMRGYVDERFGMWLAHYMVNHRVVRDGSLHERLHRTVMLLGLNGLSESILELTLQKSRTLLESGTITTNSHERQCLKHLGSWLGIITLAQNKPLLQRDMDLKELLYVGYETGHLIAVTSFVAKLLDGCKNSKIFRPPNPWTMGLLMAMREIYDIPELKLNCKFEIEVLCKSVNINLSDLKTEHKLQYRKTPPRTANPDLNIKSGPKHAVEAVARGNERTPASSPSPSGSFPASFQEATVIPNLAAYVSVNPGLALFQNNPELKRAVPVAVDRAIREIIQPVVERSVTIACITARELIVKDFAAEGDESKMRTAAHLMVSNLAGSLALVTCKEPLRVSISNHLRTLLSSAGTDAAQLDQVVPVCSAENLELGCMLIEKAATEKAMRDIDESLGPAYTARRRHREQNSAPYYDANVLGGNNRYPAALPEPFRPKAGGLQPQQLLVYEAYQRLPRQPVVPPNRSSFIGQSEVVRGSAGTPAGNRQMALDKLVSYICRFENVVTLTARSSSGRELLRVSMLSADSDAYAVLRELKAMFSDIPASQTDDIARAVCQRMFTRMYELSEPGDELLLELLLKGMEPIIAISPSIRPDVAQWVIRAPVDDKLKLHCDIINYLVKGNMLKLGELDTYLARNIDRTFVSIEFALFICRFATTVSGVVVAVELPQTIEALERIYNRYRSNPNPLAIVNQIANDLEAVRQNLQESQTQSASPNVSPAHGAVTSPPQQDQNVFRQTVSQALEQWLVLSKRSMDNEKAQAQYLVLIRQAGLLKDEETIGKFFTTATELCVESCRTTSLANKLPNSPDKVPLNYMVIDAYGRLVVFLVKYADNAASYKVGLLGRAVNAISAVLIQVHEANRKAGVPFEQRVFFRLLLGLMQDLLVPGPHLDPIHVQILSMFATMLDKLQPSNLPGFALSWMELMSHRSFLPKLLMIKLQHGWPIVHRLLLDLLLFLEPFLRTVTLSNTIRIMYRGTVRIMLMILHDFAEFLCDFHLSFCNALPPTCVQLRNLILSSFPRNMRLPDPLLPGLQVSDIADIKKSPTFPANCLAPLAHNNLSEGLTQYLNTRPSNSPFLRELPSKLLTPSSTAGTKYSIPTMNALVLFLGSNAVSQKKTSTSDLVSMDSAVMDIFMYLMQHLDAEGRYYLLNAIVNHLRYPNTHTHYFSRVSLYLFSTIQTEVVKEQITRVIIERLIAHRPHPWGLLVTFLELVRNTSYNFWGQSFLENSRELRVVFDDVARSFLGNTGSSDPVAPVAT